jgi:uncharacterized membrane protein YhaH (DUF805 family)
MTHAWHEVFAHWFGLARGVGRRDYVVAGLVLAVVKYAVEVSVFWAVTNQILTPLEFINPLLAAREKMFSPAPPWLPWLLYLWTLPFLWVAVSMSIRRATDAGFSPWCGFLVLIPLINLAIMITLCLWPSEPGESWRLVRRATESQENPWHAAVSVALGVLLGGVMIAVSI